MAIAWPRKERKVGDGMENDPQYVIEMLHITKEFPGIRANDDITLQLRKGEIHALLGENGAGKSTLMSILFGMYQPDAGAVSYTHLDVYKRQAQVGSQQDAQAVQDNSFWHHSNSPSCGPAI